MIDMHPITVAVPQLEQYRPYSGIGRVFHSLCEQWGAHVRVVGADFITTTIPLLRNFPSGVRSIESADIVLLPKLTGAQALRRAGGLPAVAIVHDIGIVDCPSDLVSTDWLTRRSLLKSFYALPALAAVIVDSDFTRDRVLHFLPNIAERVVTIHAGVDIRFLSYTRSRAEARHIVEQHAGSSLKSPLLLYVGSELPRKNISVLLRAFKHVRSRFPDAVLVKVGRAGHSQWRAETLYHLASSGLVLDQDVFVLEGVEDEMLANIYAAADVYISASLYEGFGLPALEALAVGTPVVVSNRGAHPEIVGDVGWVVEPTIEAFVTGIEAALDSVDDTQAIARRRTRAGKFTWARTADFYLSLMNRLID